MTRLNPWPAPRRMLAMALGIVGLGLAMLPGAAQAQFSKSHDFLDSVRKADGQAVTDALSQPGTTIVNTHETGSGETALEIVTERRDLTWISFLITKGADVNAHDTKGQTPLTVAAGLGFAEGVALLIDHGAAVDQPGPTGETPLIAAVHRHDLATIRALLAGGADPNRTDNSGRSAHDYALLLGKDNAVLTVLDTAPQHKNSGAAYGPVP